MAFDWRLKGDNGKYATEWKAAAWHEAAHAVVASALGVSVSTVELSMTREPSGCCKFHGGFMPYQPRHLATMLLAGAHGEALYEGANKSDIAAHARSDREQVKLMASALGVDVEMCEIHMRALIKVHQEWIARVAAALIKHKKLSGADVLALQFGLAEEDL